MPLHLEPSSSQLPEKRGEAGKQRSGADTPNVMSPPPSEVPSNCREPGTHDGESGYSIMDIAILHEAKKLVTVHILHEKPFPNDSEQTQVSVSITAEGLI